MPALEALDRELRDTDVARARTFGEWLSTGVAFAALLAVDGVMKVAGFHRFHGLVRRFPTLGRHRPGGESIRRTCSAVDRAATLYFKRAWCLQRSATVVCLLRLRGVPAELIFGVQKMPFLGHAWAELEGRVLNDSPVVQRWFRVLERC